MSDKTQGVIFLGTIFFVIVSLLFFTGKILGSFFAGAAVASILLYIDNAIVSAVSSDP